MLPLAEDVDVFLHREPVDFRKQIDGLSLIVQEGMALDPLGRSLFVFCNRRCDRIKVLYWDRTGFCLWLKRLERQRFVWPGKHDDAVIALTGEQLGWLLDGFDIFRFPPHQRLIYGAVG